jgi:hypothetical protein
VLLVGKPDRGCCGVRCQGRDDNTVVIVYGNSAAVCRSAICDLWWLRGDGEHCRTMPDLKGSTHTGLSSFARISTGGDHEFSGVPTKRLGRRIDVCAALGAGF